MERNNNYLTQANQAKRAFLTFDQAALIQKLRLRHDERYLYMTFLACPYRIHRKTGDISRQTGGRWVDGSSYEEVMTLLDLVCDSREGRYLACRWKSMEAFGLHVHRSLLEDRADPYAAAFDADPAGFSQACEALGGVPIPQGDAAYSIELFDGLPIGVQLWLGDEDFPPQLRILWDENALMYLKYETMYFARNLVLRRIKENMK